MFNQKILMSGMVGIQIILLLILFFGNKGLMDLNNFHESYSGIISENEKITTVNSDLKRQIIRLNDDKEYIESIVRNEIGMIKPDELLFQFMD